MVIIAIVKILLGGNTMSKDTDKQRNSGMSSSTDNSRSGIDDNRANDRAKNNSSKKNSK